MYKISRSKLELFIECPGCFYRDVKLSVKRPPGLPFTLNNAVDRLLKKEFDYYRGISQPHPLVLASGRHLVPLQHDDLNRWRCNRQGIQYTRANLDLQLCGVVDDVWVNEQGQLVVVDYKATAKQEIVSQLDAPHHQRYKRQV